MIFKWAVSYVVASMWPPEQSGFDTMGFAFLLVAIWFACAFVVKYEVFLLNANILWENNSGEQLSKYNNVNTFFENYLKAIHDSTSICKLSQKFFLVELIFLFNFLTYKIKVLLYNLSLCPSPPFSPTLSVVWMCVYIHTTVSAHLEVRGQLWVPFSITLHFLIFSWFIYFYFVCIRVLSTCMYICALCKVSSICGSQKRVFNLEWS